MPNIDEFIKGNSGDGGVRVIPTTFKGYRFRSRIEARWAVFFDSIGIEWQYEPQGFKLAGGTYCYLPDFLLSYANTFAEVKPFDPSPEERKKCELTVMGVGGVFVFLCGPPDFRSYPGVSRDAGMLTDATYSLDVHANFKAYFEEHRFWAFPDEDSLSEENCSQRYREAVYASRAARFDGKD